MKAFFSLMVHLSLVNHLRPVLQASPDPETLQARFRAPGTRPWNPGTSCSNVLGEAATKAKLVLGTAGVAVITDRHGNT